MLEELKAKAKVVGVKQSRKAIVQGNAVKVFLASDADPELLSELHQCCKENDVSIDNDHTMAQLGSACRISVGAAVAVLLK